MKIGARFLIWWLFLSFNGLMAQPVNIDCAHALPVSSLLNPSDSVHAIFGNSPSSLRTACLNTTSKFNDLWYSFKNVDSLFEIGVRSNLPLYVSFYDSCGAIYERDCQPTGGQFFYQYYNFPRNHTYYLRLIRVQTTDTMAHKVTFFYRNASVASNDLCKNAIPIVGNDTGYTYQPVKFLGAKSEVAGDYNADVWYSIVPSRNILSVKALMNGKTDGLTFNVEVYDACGGKLLSNSFETVNPISVIPGKKYFLRVYNIWSYTDNNTFSLGTITLSAPANDSCSHATVLTPSLDTPVYTQVNLKNMTPWEHACNGDAYDVWYQFTAQSTSTTLYFKNTDQQEAYYNVHLDCNSGLLCKGNDPSYLFTTVKGKTYYISVFLPNSNVGKDKLCSIAVVQNKEYPMTSCATAQEVKAAADNSCTYTSIDFSQVVKTARTVYAWYKFKPLDSLQVIRVNTVGSGVAYTLMQDCTFPVYGALDETNQNFSIIYSKFNPNAYYYLEIAYTPQTYSSLAEGPLVSFCINSPKVPNDDCAQAILLTDSCFKSKLMDLSTATKSPNPSCQPKISNDVWFKFSTTANAGIKYAFMLQSNAYTSSLSTSNYVLELSEGCSASSPRCIRRAEYVYDAGGDYSIIEYMLDSLKANTNYSLRLIMVDLKYGNTAYPTQLYYRWIKSDPSIAGDFYLTPKVGVYGNYDQQCFTYQPCATSSLYAPQNINSISSTLGFYDNWYRFQASSSKLGFVMDNNFYYELYRDGNVAPSYKTPLNTFHRSYNQVDSLAYFQTAVDSGFTYLLRIASLGPYDTYSKYGSAICMQSLHKNNVGDTCATPIQLTENVWTNAPLTSALTASKPNTCVSFSSHNRAWLRFQSGNGAKHITLNGQSSALVYAELYTSCSTLVSCIGPIQGNSFNISLTSNTTYYLKLYSNTQLLFNNTVQVLLSDGLLSSLEEDELENGVQIYPNPAQDILYMKGLEDQMVTLFDFSGKIIQLAQVKEGQLLVDGLPNGLYFIEIGQGRRKFTIIR